MGLLRQVLAYLCMFIYDVIAWVYELFINISRVEILSSDEIEPIYQRFTLILSIIMVFYITFEFVKFVVQPEGLVDKEKGAQKTVFKMIIVVVLIAFVPSIFNWGYKLQNVVFDNQLFSKIILGKRDVEMKDIGRDFSANLLSMFYYVDESIEWQNENRAADCGDLSCKQIVSLNLEYMRKYGKSPYLTMGLDETEKAIEPSTGDKVDEYKINFNGFFAIGVGAFVAYMLILYCVDAGVRVVQLMFLQIIAPIPIIGYLSPKKEGIFQKWVRQCTTTYLDLFIRVGIIYFVLLIAQILTKAVTDGTILENATSQDDWMKTIMFVAIIMGLLLFAKKAPNLLKELFPSTSAASGNFGLKAGERVAPMAARVIGGTLGGAGGLLRGAVVNTERRAQRNKLNNQKNGITKQWFTKEGQEQRKKARETQKANRAQARQTSRDRKKSEQVEGNVSAADMDKSKQRVKTAAAKLAEAEKLHGKDSAEAKAAQSELAQASKSHRELVARKYGIAPETENTQTLRQNQKNAASELNAARAELASLSADDPRRAAVEARVARAEQSYSEARTALLEDKKSRMTSSPLGENQQGLIEASENAKTSQQAVKDAEQALAKADADLIEAYGSGDEGKIARAEQAKKEAEQNLATANQNNVAAQQKKSEEVDRYRMISSGDVQGAKSKEHAALEQVAEDRRTREISSVAEGAVGGIVGAWYGATTGAQATKLEEVWSKSKEGWAKGVKRDQELAKYYDNGGRAGIEGFVDRTVTKVEQTVGLDTGYARTMQSIQPIEQNMKEMDAQISLAKDASSAADNADSIARGKSKELKSKARAGAIKTGLKDKDGNTIYAEVAPGETTGEVVRKYHGRAALAKSEAETATNRADLAEREAQEARAKANKAKEDPSVTEEQRNALEAEAVRKEKEAVDANNNKVTAAQAAQDAQFEAEQVEKNAARDEITQILSNPNGSNYHPALVQKVMEGKESLRTALANPQLRELMRQEIYRTSKTTADAARIYNAFLTQNITDFDTFDAISTAYKNVANTVSRSKADAAEQVRQIQTSSYTESQKAAQDYNGSGK